VSHTPGPWYMNGSELIGDSTILATLCWHSGRDVENKADERLIAAAPDLLAALKAVMDGMDHLWKLENLYTTDRAYAAIAKATGEAL
jgi:hypothetical protein